MPLVTGSGFAGSVPNTTGVVARLLSLPLTAFESALGGVSVLGSVGARGERSSARIFVAGLGVFKTIVRRRSRSVCRCSRELVSDGRRRSSEITGVSRRWRGSAPSAGGSSVLLSRIAIVSTLFAS